MDFNTINFSSNILLTTSGLIYFSKPTGVITFNGGQFNNNYNTYGVINV